MRARTLARALTRTLLVATVFWMPAHAAAEISLTASVISAPAIPAAPPNTYESAYKPGDSIQLVAFSLNPDLAVSADLSALGVSSTTVSAANGPYYGPIYGTFYPNVYAYYIGPFAVGSVGDDLKNVRISGMDSLGNATSTSISLMIDSAPPRISITNVSFSTTTPAEGDYMYISGTFDGTGSTLTFYGLNWRANDENGVNVDGCGNIIGVDTAAFSAAIASSTDGTFTNVPVQMYECGHPAYMASHGAKTITLSADVYDEAGNTAHTELTVPYPRPAPPPAGVSNVLFLPGTEASRLYMRDSAGAEHEVWEPTLAADVSKLALNPDGSSQNQLYTRDIIGTFFGNDLIKSQIVQTAFGRDAMVYRDFEEYMDSLVASSTLGLKEWKAYPYDWRYDVRDVVSQGTWVGNRTGMLTRVYLQDVVKEMASSSPTGKVTIVAHSNGGLLAKALTDAMGAEASRYIDRIVMIGTPQWGTPSTIGAMEHADNFSDLPNFIINKLSTRSVELGLPDAYDLFPSRAYFTHVSDPVVTFNQSGGLTRPYAAAYGSGVSSYPALANFLTDSAHLDTTTGSANSLKSLVPLDSVLLGRADSMHSEFDAWVPPAGIQVTSIAGWGQDTVKTLNYWTGSHTVCSGGGVFSSGGCADSPELEHAVVTTQDGDGTVVSPSAIGDAGQRWYFDSFLYEKTNNKITHQDLTSASPIQDIVRDLLTQDSVAEPFLIQDKPTGGASPITLRISSHSPVNILLTDAAGNESGVLPIPGTDFSGMKQDIPGSSVFVLDDEEYIDVPQDGNYQVHVTGYGNGPTTLHLERVDQNGVATTTGIFADIPTTASTSASFSVNNGVATSPLVDTNGDGKTDLTVISVSSSTDPLQYVTYMRKVITAMGLDKKIAFQLDAKLINIAHLITRDGRWDKDDEDKDDSPRGMKLDQRIERRIEKLIAYVNRQAVRDVNQQNKRHSPNSQTGISSDQAEVILGMLKELQILTP